MKLLIVLGLWNQMAAPPLADSTPLQHKRYKTTIVTNTTGKVNGYFYSIDDTAISLTSAPFPKRGLAYGVATINKYEFQDLKTVQFRRKGSIGRGAVYGGLIGLSSGALAGLASKPQSSGFLTFSRRDQAIIFGTLGAVQGLIAGLIVGAFGHKVFRINGRKERYNEMKTQISKKVYARSQ
jgi:hypothetical protein